jgi:two-component system, OmpR family, response regulator
MTEGGNVHADTLSRALLVIEKDQMPDPALASIPVIFLAGAGDLPESVDLLGDVRQKPAVLVVDDVVAIGTMLDLALSQGGFAVTLATTGNEAIELYRKHHDKFALVLMDVQMAGMDGPTTLAILRQINPELKCCFMSGSTGKYTSQELLDMGAVHVTMKPFVNLSILTQFLWDMIG